MNKVITKTVWMLSLVSLFTDIASEMLYPVMPVFLKYIGFSYVLIGVLEGFAEAVAGLSKPYFGRLSDEKGKRLPFVQLGYSLSALSKPMMAVLFNPLWIFFARSLDRLGKGIRTGARDALLSDEATPETKARVFGFHRSMDTLGAVTGPAVALLFLYFYPASYKTLFLLAFIPGLLAIFSSILIKEKPAAVRPVIKNDNKGIFGFITYWKKSPEQYKRLVIGLLLFALFNSSDAFLLLKMKAAGLSDTMVIAVYIFYNLVYALLAYPLGKVADRIGMKKVMITGLILFMIVYAGFGISNNLYIYFTLFALYGCYAAATEGISKAWISNMVPKTETGTAIGTFTGLQSIAALIASSLTGFAWYSFGPKPAFLITAGVTLIAVIYLSGISYSQKQNQ